MDINTAIYTTYSVVPSEWADTTQEAADGVILRVPVISPLGKRVCLI